MNHRVVGTTAKMGVGRLEEYSTLHHPHPTPTHTPPFPWVAVCAEVSSLDKVFMTSGQFSSHSQELPPNASGFIDESFMIRAAEAELDAAHVGLITSLPSV